MIIFANDCVAVNKTVVNKYTILSKNTLILGGNGILLTALTTTNNKIAN